ncbi:TRAP C4-dicarboxylate transport system permease DctM subunit [Thalassospira sp. KO164]|nr:TRAP C4-dicarboxylate transport system permease DctM subunit [Thalassospira sp. KO164]
MYGVSAELSIARLFIAGILPGAMLIILFMGFVMIWATLNKDKMPPAGPDMGFMEKVRASGRLIPVIVLIASVIGSIYGGIATPTEAAAFGVVGALILSAISGSLNRASFIDGLMGATRTSCMIGFILAGAAVLTVTMGFTGIPRELAAWIAEMNLSPYALLAALTVFFIVLGCFLDGISVVVLTTSVILPMVQAAGSIFCGLASMWCWWSKCRRSPAGRFQPFRSARAYGQKPVFHCTGFPAVLLPAFAGGFADYGLPRNRHLASAENERLTRAV